jgi:GNAT superfamily N-acetyltransferase
MELLIRFIRLKLKMNEYAKVPFGCCPDKLVQRCADLFSNNYGIWDNGNRVELSPLALRQQYMYNESCGLVYVEINKEHVGHCFFMLFPVKNKIAVWITQLVVHAAYRNKGIATQLVQMAFPLDWSIAGMASSNPFAIKAFEFVARRRCTLKSLQVLARYIMPLCPVSYLINKTCYVDSDHSIIDSEFLINHMDSDIILSGVILAGNWILGNDLPKGYEFLALVRRK